MDGYSNFGGLRKLLDFGGRVGRMEQSIRGKVASCFANKVIIITFPSKDL